MRQIIKKNFQALNKNEPVRSVEEKVLSGITFRMLQSKMENIFPFTVAQERLLYLFLKKRLNLKTFGMNKQDQKVESLFAMIKKPFHKKGKFRSKTIVLLRRSGR